MGLFRSDYQSYRGRKTVTDWLKRIAMVLAVLVVLALAVLLLGQNYIQYTDDGLRVDLPFLQQQQQEGQDLAGVDVVIDQSAESGQQPNQPQPEERKQTALNMVSVPTSALLDKSAEEMARQAGADGVVVDMKDSQGVLSWHSQQALVRQGEEPEVNQGLMEWNQGGVYTVARLKCFRDENLGRDMERTILTKSGYRWRDKDGLHWGSPASFEVQSYLLSLMVELAELGFDEIVLEDCGFPAEINGSRNNIRWKEDPAQVMGEFLHQADQALEPYDVKLSIRLSADAAMGLDPNTGLTAAYLEQVADRIWVDGMQTDVAAALGQAGVSRLEERLVSVSEALSQDMTTPQAALS